jgi:monosaccharide-transporting ATPase
VLTDRVLLKMEHISKRFSDTVLALKDVSFQLQRGEIHALLGENGAGKSTLIKVLTGVEKRSSGSVIFEGKEIQLQSPQEAQKNRNQHRIPGGEFMSQPFGGRKYLHREGADDGGTD